MTFSSLLIDEVVITNLILESDETDRYGNVVPSEDTVTVSARVQPVSSGEDLIDRDTRITKYLVFLPAGTDVDGLSVLTWQSKTLRVVGEPRTFADRTAAHHVELDAEEVLA